MTKNTTAERLLDTAQQLIQQRGYNAFSYSDLADSVGIRTASIHYHFPTKTDLGLAIMERYTQQLRDQLAEIDHGTSPTKGRLKRFIGLYRATEEKRAMCLCGSLASDLGSLAEPIQEAVAEYLKLSRDWVGKTVARGVERGELAYTGKPADAAMALISGLQGSLILARARGEQSLIDTIQRVCFETLDAK